MIYKFRMLTGDEKAFLRDYEIDSNQNFLDFHKLIQGNLKYDVNQITSFFIADESWSKGLELTLIDMENEGGPAAIPMESVRIKDLLKQRKDRLLYVFDIFNDNLFFIELLDIFPPKSSVKYPICSASVGEPPVVEDFGARNMPLPDDDFDDSVDDIFDEYQSDEFDLGEGYDGDE